jgi:hypothetical protein
MDGQEPIPMSPREVKLWIYDDPHAPPAARSNPISAGYTRPFSPSSPDSPTTPVCRRIILGGRYKVPILLWPTDNTSVQSTSHTSTPSRGCSPCHPLSSLFPLMPLLITGNPFVEPSPTTDAATSEEYSLGDAAPSRGHHVSHTPFTPSAPGGWI